MSDVTHGQRCPSCGQGVIKIRSSSRVGDRYVQYLKCSFCGMNGGKNVAEAETVVRRTLSETKPQR